MVALTTTDVITFCNDISSNPEGLNSESADDVCWCDDLLSIEDPPRYTQFQPYLALQLSNDGDGGDHSCFSASWSIVCVESAAMFNDTLLAPIYMKILVKDSKGQCKKEAMKHTVSKWGNSCTVLVAAVAVGLLCDKQTTVSVVVGAGPSKKASSPPKANLSWSVLPKKPLSLSAMSVVLRQISFTGSIIGSPAQIEEMLAFVAEKGVNSIVEVLPMSDAALHNVDNMGTIDMIQ
ncbi:hypothetical protein AeNC1_015314 [Aphanomyces euteiches]|nr:hypothetical protein AeNC1_015314 [Aphanomyces euteiches]